MFLLYSASSMCVREVEEWRAITIIHGEERFLAEQKTIRKLAEDRMDQFFEWQTCMCCMGSTERVREQGGLGKKDSDGGIDGKGEEVDLKENKRATVAITFSMRKMCLRSEKKNYYRTLGGGLIWIRWGKGRQHTNWDLEINNQQITITASMADETFFRKPRHSLTVEKLKTYTIFTAFLVCGVLFGELAAERARWRCNMYSSYMHVFHTETHNNLSTNTTSSCFLQEKLNTILSKQKPNIYWHFFSYFSSAATRGWRFDIFIYRFGSPFSACWRAYDGLLWWGWSSLKMNGQKTKIIEYTKDWGRERRSTLSFNSMVFQPIEKDSCRLAFSPSIRTDYKKESC